MNNYILGLDIGSVEIRAIIAKNDGEFSICGVGIAKTFGIKKGVITNIEQAANSIKQAVNEAVKRAGRKYDKVIVSISGAYTKSVQSTGVITIPDREITLKEIERVMQMAEHTAEIPSDFVKLHILPYDFKVDSQEHIEDPLGMSGSRLEVLTHIIMASEGTIKNLTKAVELAGVKIDNIVLAGYASSIATLTDDEKELGTLLIDMGGATSDMVIHLGNSLRYNDVLLLGSSNITNDLSKTLKTPLPYAEDVKLRYTELMDNGEREIQLPVLGENDETHNVSMEIITNVTYARIEEILMLLAKKLNDSGYKDKISAGVVLTGGMPKLDDVRELAIAIFGSISVRVAKPKKMSGLFEISDDLANSCAIGLCMYGFGEFTPYEIDSNNNIRYKKELLKKTIIAPTYEEDIDKAIETKVEDRNNVGETEGGLKLEVPKISKPNVLKQLWNKLTQLF